MFAYHDHCVCISLNYSFYFVKWLTDVFELLQHHWTLQLTFFSSGYQGYQLMKDEKMYGSIMPPDVHSLRIKDCTLGDRIQLQILALTDHPVGRDGKAIKEQQKDDNNTEAGDSGIADTQSGK